MGCGLVVAAVYTVIRITARAATGVSRHGFRWRTINWLVGGAVAATASRNTQTGRSFLFFSRPNGHVKVIFRLTFIRRRLPTTLRSSLPYPAYSFRSIRFRLYQHMLCYIIFHKRDGTSCTVADNFTPHRSRSCGYCSRCAAPPSTYGTARTCSTCRVL